MPTVTEQRFIDKMTKEGWDIYHTGFPDFLCIKGKDVQLVEVKGKKGEKLRPHQVKMGQLLNKVLGVKVGVWSPDSSQIINLTEYEAYWLTYEYHPTNTKISRNKSIARMHNEFPSLTYAEIGEVFNISRQRTHQIIQGAK